MPEVPKYVPLSELDRVSPPPRVTFDGVIPEFVDREQIGINLRAINRLCKLSGIRNLRVVGVSGDTTSFTPDIVGADNKGHAIAAWKGTMTKVSTYDMRFGSPDKDYLLHANRWIDTTLNINTNEISTRIGESKVKGGLRSTHAWSDQINKALKGGIRETGFNHLVLNTSLGEKFFAAWYDSQLITGITPSNMRLFLGLHSGVNALEYLVDRTQFGKNEDGQHISLFYGPQLDRAAVLGIAGRATKLVKALSPKS